MSVDATREHVLLARRNAVIAVIGVAVFAALVIALVTVLDGIAGHSHLDEVDVGGKPYVERPLNILLIGSDSRKGTALYTGKANEHAQVDQHSDIMTIMHVNPKNYSIAFITVPRDTVMPGNPSAKINDALLENDPEEVVDAVEELTGATMDYYVMTTFTAFEDLVDALGGIKVDVPKTVRLADPATGKRVTVKEGKKQKLNGAQALVLARVRKDYEVNQDALRQVNVRNIEKAMVRKVLEQGADIDLEGVLTALEENTTTNLDLSSVGMMVLDFVNNSDEVSFFSATGPYEGGEREVDGQWVVDSSPQTWAAIMSAVDAGQDPSSIVKAPSF